jgi:glycosyltransferase involved in cell wall biosynthesis
MHTQPVDENGTDLPAVVDAIASEYNVVFSDSRMPVEELNLLYNIADCTINIANNEGFGLATAESVVAGTPIIVNVTGGLQDQCGFKLDGKYLTHEDYIKIGSLHQWREWEGKLEHGEWAYPIWSRALALAGSVPTPYIWDDRVDNYEVAEVIEKVYNTPKPDRKAAGLRGREEFLGNMGLSHTNMCDTLVEGIETTFENWKPRERFEVFKIK